MLIGVLAACFAAAHATAAPAPSLFALSIAATSHAEWDHTGSSRPVGDCDRTIRSEGIRDVRFRTAKPTVVRFVGGRLSAAGVGALTGTVTLAGANTVTDVCGADRSEAIQDCARTKRTFGGGTIGVAGTQPGLVTFRPARNVRLRTSTCPEEPAQVVRAPLGPLPNSMNASTAALANPRFRRITLSASVSRTTSFGPDAQGTMKQRSAWKVTLERIQR